MKKKSGFEELFDQRLDKAPPAFQRNETSTEGKVGRPARGKKSDPNYKQFSVLLKKETQKRAVRKLEDLETGQDFSDLVQEVLEQWLGK